MDTIKIVFSGWFRVLNEYLEEGHVFNSVNSHVKKLKMINLD